MCYRDDKFGTAVLGGGTHETIKVLCKTFGSIGTIKTCTK